MVIRRVSPPLRCREGSVPAGLLPEPGPEAKLLDLFELVRFLKLKYTARQLRKAVRDGSLKHVRIGRRVFFDPEFQRVAAGRLFDLPGTY
jgi:hypothetical protein